VRSAELAMEPTQTSRPDGADAEKVLTFLDALEEHEDVQRVYSNADFDEAQLEALA
jgi:transcriptional/translational regulatory protein YebC/TACO1